MTVNEVTSHAPETVERVAKAIYETASIGPWEQGGLFYKDVARAQARAALDAMPTGGVSREQVVEQLRDLYVCTRHESAWSFGTMSLDDFVPAWENEDVVHNFLALVNSPVTVESPDLDAGRMVLEHWLAGPSFRDLNHVREWIKQAGNDPIAAIVKAVVTPTPREVPAVSDDRLPECVERWPGAVDGEYDPRCCRFPKSCSAGSWSANVPVEGGDDRG